MEELFHQSPCAVKKVDELGEERSIRSPEAAVRRALEQRATVQLERSGGVEHRVVAADGDVPPSPLHRVRLREGGRPGERHEVLRDLAQDPGRVGSVGLPTRSSTARRVCIHAVSMRIAASPIRMVSASESRWRS